jgi:hypothetical protein
MIRDKNENFIFSDRRIDFTEIAQFHHKIFILLFYNEGVSLTYINELSSLPDESNHQASRLLKTHS